MSMYIHPDNQKVLWNTINKAKGFSDKPDADQWFKQTISDFYHHNSNRNLDLLTLNKATIEYMVQQLKPKMAPTKQQDPDTKMSMEEMNDRLNYRYLQDQIDELRGEIEKLKKPT